MKHPIAYLKEHKLTAAYLLALAALLIALALELWMNGSGQGIEVAFLLLVIAALGGLAAIGWRVSRFRARAFALLRRLVAGNYESGLAAPAHWHDEVSGIEDLFNKLVEQLRQYDELRTRRIRQLRMTIDLILEHSGEPMALFDAEKDTLEFNRAMGGCLDTPRKTIPLSTLRNIEPNNSFAEMLTRAVEDQKEPQEGEIELQFPGQEASAHIAVRVLPFKNKDGSVPVAVIFGKRVHDAPPP